ncbi:MAG: hypothetical protein ISEC1_P0342 [Thiomicrorhabdus sp.]|nr:MAG: hypothetical protein ISEC1_P0342 [Thiomicrorhabdus sp.]
MSNHHNNTDKPTDKMNDPVDKVLEGEVVKEALETKPTMSVESGKSTKNEKIKDDQSKASDSVKSGDLPEQGAWKLKVAKWGRYSAWGLAVAGVIGTLYFTRPDMDWQVQHINDLQSKVTQLHQSNQALEKRLDSQSEMVTQRIQELVTAAVSQPENKAIITQADLTKIEETAQQQITQLQTNLENLGLEVSNQIETAITAASELKSSAQATLQPTEQQLEALNQLEEKLQGQLSVVGGKLSELLDFKSNQLSVPKNVPQEAPVMKFTEKLSQVQINQWIVEINTQWLLKGHTEASKQQLLALEQAIVASKLPQSNQLIRLLGQDLSYLTQFKADEFDSTTLNTQALKEAINALDAAKVQKPTSPPPAESSDAALISQSEPMDTPTALEQLKSKLSQMISFKKREDASQTQVENLLMQDVIVQRALLFLDRIDWAIQSESENQLKTAVQDLQEFIDHNFSSQSRSFIALLKPFLEVSFMQRQPLAISRLLSK